MTLAWPGGVVGNIQTENAIALGSPQTSPLTGSTQGGGSSVILWSLDVEFPPQSNLLNVMAARNILAQAKQDTVLIRVYQPGLGIGTTGTITVGTGHVAGTKTLPIVGVNSGLAMFAGQFISVGTAGRYYLYTLAADSPAGTTSRTLTLTSTTRAAHVNTNPVEVATPYIEGWVEQSSISVTPAGHYIFKVSIREAA